MTEPPHPLSEPPGFGTLLPLMRVPPPGPRSRALTAGLGMSTAQFTRRYCAKTDGHWHIRDAPGALECRFLSGKRCTVYDARPTQCRTWPFWPEVMHAKAWQREVAKFCPGVGKGRLWSVDEIRAVLERQADANRKP